MKITTIITVMRRNLSKKKQNIFIAFPPDLYIDLPFSSLDFASVNAGATKASGSATTCHRDHRTISGIARLGKNTTRYWKNTKCIFHSLVTFHLNPKGTGKFPQGS